MKSLLNAIFLQTLWPIKRPERAAALAEPHAVLLWGSALGVAAGIAAAATFLGASLLLPVRVAILLAILVGLSGSVPRPSSPLASGQASPGGAALIALLLLAKLEVLAEIDQDWVSVTLICSCAWARAATLATRKRVFVAIPAASKRARLGALLIGALPLAALGVWPEPVWGLWVAAALTWIVAMVVAPTRWAANITVRWLLGEVVFCLSVLALLSAAAMTEIAAEDAPEF